MTISPMFVVCSLNCLLGGVIVVLSAIIISHNRRLALMERGKLEPVRARRSSFFSRPVVAATMTPADGKSDEDKAPDPRLSDASTAGSRPAEPRESFSFAGRPKPECAPAFVAPKASSAAPCTPVSGTPPTQSASVTAVFQGVLKSQEKRQLSLKQEINQMLADGMDLAQIADHLGISAGTVRLAAAVRNAETSALHSAASKEDNRRDPARNPRNWTDVSDMKGAWCVGTAQ
jgi:hypothetical protein